MKFKFFSFLVLSICISLSCQDATRKEDMEKIKQLKQIVGQAEDVLVVDDKVIQLRVDTIRERLLIFKPVEDKIKDDETKGALLILKGIQINYERFLKDYPSVVYDNDVLVASTIRLDKDLKDGTISHERFEKQFDSLMPISKSHLDTAIACVQKIRVIDNEYHRKNLVLENYISAYLKSRGK